MTLTCIDCPASVSRQSKSGRCRACAARRALADPEVRARMVAGLRRQKATPEGRATALAAAQKREDRRRGDPQWHAFKVACGKRLRADYEASEEGQAKNRANRAEVGRKISATRLAHIPEHLRPRYRALRKDRPAAEAAQIVLAEAAEAERARLAAMTPFERQLERVRNGARLVEKPVLRRADHDFTLGGVATGML